MWRCNSSGVESVSENRRLVIVSSGTAILASPMGRGLSIDLNHEATSGRLTGNPKGGMGHKSASGKSSQKSARRLTDSKSDNRSIAHSRQRSLPEIDWESASRVFHLSSSTL